MKKRKKAKKSTIVFVTIAMLAIICVGCGKGKEKNKIPDGMSEEAYNTGCEAVNILEHYLDMDIDADTASDKLNALDTDFESGVLNAKVTSRIAKASLMTADINSGWGKYSDVDVRELVKDFKEILEIE